MATVTGAQYRDECITLGTGKQYSSLPGYRLGPDSYDCSGLMQTAAARLGLTVPGISATMARWCHEAGLDQMPVTVALGIPGCWLFHGPNFGYDGWGPTGHVACTIGDGVHTIEAHSAYTTPEVGIFTAVGQPWTNASKIPGIDYGTGPTPPGAVGMTLSAQDIETLRQVFKQTLEDGIGGSQMAPTPDAHATIFEVVKHVVTPAAPQP